MNTRYIAEEYRLAHWMQIMQERNESGLSIKAFCKKVGINETSYFYWQRKLREAACEQIAIMHPDSTASGLICNGFAEVKLQDNLPHKTLTEAVSRGNLNIEISGIKITADSTYPENKLAYLLRELVESC